jgi:basic amino acid/polyamine antiporter, APA family
MRGEGDVEQKASRPPAPSKRVEGRFRRDLGLRSAVTIVVGSMVGSGILLLPADMARLVGSPWLLVAAWLAPGLLVLAGALMLAELVSAYPKAGGQYVFLREGLGPFPAFLFGWTMFWVILTGILAAVAVAFARFVDFFLPLPGVAFALGPLLVPKWGVALVASGVLALLGALNALGVRYGGWVQDATTALKLTGLVGIVLAMVAWGQPRPGALDDLMPAGGGLAGFAAAATLALFAFDALPQATFVAAEVREPERNLPRALVAGALLVLLVYLLTIVAVVLALPMASIAGSPRPVSDAAAAALGPTGAVAITMVALVSTFGTLNGYVLTSPRVFYALARDGALLRGMGELGRRGTPVLATVLCCEWAALLAMTGTYAQIVTLVVFATWLFYLPTVVAYLRLRAQPGYAPRFRAPLHPLTPGVFAVAGVLVLATTLATSPVQALVGVALVASGLPAWAWQQRRRGTHGLVTGDPPATSKLNSTTSDSSSRPGDP